MNALIVYAHPEPRSFNGAMKDLAVETLTAAGHRVTVADLYREGFNPAAGPWDFTSRGDPERFELGAEQARAARHRTFAPDVQREIDRLFAADLVVLQFPMWWFSMPAMLKGWIDRVFAFGTAYDFGKTWDRGVLRGRRAMLSMTTSAPPSVFQPDGRNGDLERILWPIHAGALALCGYNVLPPFVGYGVPFVGTAGRQAILDRFRERLLRIETTAPLYFHPLADYTPEGRLREGIEPRTPGQHRPGQPVRG